MSSPLKKKLGLHRLTEHDIGSFQFDMMNMMAHSPDPFASVLYSINIGPVQELLKKIREMSGKNITLGNALNKLLALAVSEHPIFNQVILGGNIYRVEGIHIANAFLMPGGDPALAYVVIDNPHLKSLEQIYDDFLLLAKAKTLEYESQSRGVRLALRYYFKFRLYRLLSEKISFTVGFQNGLTSNIVLSNHVYSGPATFTVIKPIITPMKISLRIHSGSATQQPVVENGTITIQERIPLHFAIDHRMIHGIHVHRFGKTLEHIAAEPEKYLL